MTSASYWYPTYKCLASCTFILQGRGLASGILSTVLWFMKQAMKDVKDIYLISKVLYLIYYKDIYLIYYKDIYLMFEKSSKKNRFWNIIPKKVNRVYFFKLIPPPLICVKKVFGIYILFLIILLNNLIILHFLGLRVKRKGW